MNVARGAAHSNARLIIRSDRMVENVTQLRQAFPNLFFFGVLKSNAYGLGAEVLAPLLEAHVDGFAVATAQEAFALRDAGVRKPILSFGYVEPQDVLPMVERGVRPAVDSFALAEAFSQAAQRCGKKAAIHLAVDTGHQRIGFIAGAPENRALYEKIAGLPNLRMEGTYSHLSTADEADPSFTEEQVARFAAEIAVQRAAGLQPAICHLANSAGLLAHGPETRFSGVRIGDGIYGLYTSPEVRKKSPVSLRLSFRWEATISNVKQIAAGTSVGYGRTWVAPRETRLVTVQVGYADGYPRALSNCGTVLIHGISCPIRGRVCMDQMMVEDRSGKAAIGDSVILFGTCPETGATLDHFTFEEQSGTILQETLVHITDRVERIYETEDGR
uniref:alanine racemase n=1 Tax=Ndongobacter massiliensis TaxID=1871025 RepID=UPI0009309814|nr:alanine racemase [Ndongobacter massiliensis]